MIPESLIVAVWALATAADRAIDNARYRRVISLVRVRRAARLARKALEQDSRKVVIYG